MKLATGIFSINGTRKMYPVFAGTYLFVFYAKSFYSLQFEEYMKKILVLLPLLIYCSVFGQSLKSPDNMITKGITEIPASIAAEVGRYTEFRTAAFMGWHPVKREMLISTRFGDVAQIHNVAFPLGARTQLTFFKEPVSSPRWEPNTGTYLIFNKDVGGSENYQIYRMDVADGKITMLTDGKSRNGNVQFSQKGDKILYSSNKRNGNDVDFYIMDPLHPETDRLLCENKGGGWAVLDWAPDDSRLLAMEEISAEESYLYVIDSKTGTKSLLTPKPEKGKILYSGAEFDKTGKGIYLTTDKDNEFSRLAYMNLKDLAITFIAKDTKWDVNAFSLNKKKDMLLYELNEEGVSRLQLLDLKSNKLIALPALPVGVIGGFAWHNNGEDIGFTFNSARSQADAYVINLKKKTLTRWTKSETAGLATDKLPEAKLIKWKSFDGLTISGFLYTPPAKFSGKHPVIIDVHGGPEGQSYPSFLGRNNYYLNELGVAIVFPNVRGSTGFGKTFLSMDNGFLRENSYKDVAALIDWIKQQPDLDAEHIMVTGGSYGGNVTLAMSAFYSDKIACALSVVGASNLVTFLENTSGYRRDLRRVEYGDERDPKMREYLLKIAPINSVDKIKKPLFIVQGANDPRVPASEAEQIVKKMEEMKIPVWYMLAKDEGHGFAKKVNRDYQFYATVMFIKQYLLK